MNKIKLSYNPPPNGRYGQYGGCYLPEILMPAILELEQACATMLPESSFQEDFLELLQQFAGRSTPLTDVKRFSSAINSPKILLKREDLLHTGAHKINNALGQCLLARKMGKKRIIAETGAGQHGVATATACAHLGLDCVVYMGSVDIERQAPNVEKMRLLGATVHAVNSGSKTLKDAVNAALRDWSASFADTHYCLGSALGPHPYPAMVAFFQQIIGLEARAQCLEQTGKLPTAVVACVGGGSNAIGIFSGFINDCEVKFIGVEAGGVGNHNGEHAARFLGGSPGVLHGCYTYLLQDDNGQVLGTQSISAGLDYPAIGPQHACLQDKSRATYTNVSDQQALHAFKLLSQTEGIIPALESSHALAYMIEQAANFSANDCIIINLSGRGDKDLPYLLENKIIAT